MLEPTKRSFIEAGANLNARYDGGFTALMEAIITRDDSTIELLFEHITETIDERDNDGDTALFMAINFSRIDIVKRLIDAGTDIYTRDRFLKTPLMEAVNYAQPDIVTLLIERYDDEHINAVDHEGYTALDLVYRYLNRIDVRNSKWIIIRDLLIARGAIRNRTES